MDVRQQEIIDAFVKKHGRGKAEKILSVLSKNQQFINALENPIGQELLKDLVEMAETRLEILANIDVDKSKEKFIEAQCNYRSVINLLGRWSKRLENHAKRLHEIQT